MHRDVRRGDPRLRRPAGTRREADHRRRVDQRDDHAEPRPGDEQHERRRQTDDQGRRGDLAGPQRTGVAQHDDPLPAAVLEVLAPEIAQRTSWRVLDDELGIEPDDVAGLAEAPVEFVVLIADQALVVATDVVERRSSKGTEIHRVGRPLMAPGAELGGSDTETRPHRRGDALRPARGPDRPLDTADVGGARAGRGLEDALQVAHGNLGLGVDPHDEIALRGLDRPVERSRCLAGRVLDPSHPVVARRPGLDPIDRVVGRRPDGDDHVEAQIDLLGQQRLETTVDHGRRVASRNHDRQRPRRGDGVDRHRADRRAITTMVSIMIMRSSTGDQFTTYCRSWPSL